MHCLGSVRAVTDSTGWVVQTYGSDAWGAPVAAQTVGSVSQPMQFTGEPRDSTGLVYLRARLYDPQSGRFVQRDRFGGVKRTPVSLNHFSYVRGNPVTLRDPSGLFCVGASGGLRVEGGLGPVGAAGTAAAGPVGCADPEAGLSAGAMAAAGYFVNGLTGEQFGDQATGGNFSVGAFAGAGAGPFLSNAQTPKDLEGPFDTISLDVSIPPVPAHVSVQVGVSGDTWIAGVTVGPGEGLAVSRLVTTTLVAWIAEHKKK